MHDRVNVVSSITVTHISRKSHILCRRLLRPASNCNAKLQKGKISIYCTISHKQDTPDIAFYFNTNAKKGAKIQTQHMEKNLSPSACSTRMMQKEPDLIRLYQTTPFLNFTNLTMLPIRHITSLLQTSTCHEQDGKP